MTVFAWNALALAGLLTWAFLIAHPSTPASDEDWGGLVAAIFVVFGGAGLLVATGVGAWIARTIMTKRIRNAAQSSRQASVTTGAARLAGTGAAVLGWVCAGAAATLTLLVFTLVNR